MGFWAQHTPMYLYRFVPSIISSPSSFFLSSPLITLTELPVALEEMIKDSLPAGRRWAVVSDAGGGFSIQFFH